MTATHTAEAECGKPFRNGDTCHLPAGHRSKRHSSITFYCDVCGKTLPGHPTVQDADINACFLCVREYETPGERPTSRPGPR